MRSTTPSSRSPIGPETEVFERPRGKDIDVQMVVDLRRMLTAAGLGPADESAVADERTRDHGDSRWGSPDLVPAPPAGGT